MIPRPTKELITQKQIEEAVCAFAQRVSQECCGKELHIVAVLKGAIFFLVDLVRLLKCPVQIHFVKASSYGMRGKERGKLQLKMDDLPNLKDKEILLLDDIFDSGETFKSLAQALQAMRPRSLKTAVLLLKKRQRTHRFLPDTSLFEVEDTFVVGYGLDYKELYRNLPSIYSINN